MLNDMRKAMPGTQIIVQGLYPRGADFGANKFTYPNNFTSAVAYLNAEYQVRVILRQAVRRWISD
jgi:hypothetical protein